MHELLVIRLLKPAQEKLTKAMTIAVDLGRKATKQTNIYQCHQRFAQEKYLNLEGFLDKSLKIKYAWKSTGKSLKSLEKSLISTISVRLSTVDRDLYQYKIVVPLFGAAFAAPNIGTTILYLFSSTNVSHYLSLAFLK